MIMTVCAKGIVGAVALAAVTALAAPAAAQEVSFGYQMQRFSSEGDSLNTPFGVDLSVAGSGTLTGVGQVDWSRKHESATVLGTSLDGNADFAAFAGGLRWNGRGNPGATPFVDVLFGVMRSSGSARVAGEEIGSGSSTDPMLQLGGGVSVPVAGGVGIFGQFDYRRIFSDGSAVNAVRFVAGLRLSAK
jgi:hypothetical protein